MEIYFVTGNKNKLQEARAILDQEIQSVSLDLPEIQALYAEETVKDKAMRAFDAVQKPVMVEDVGFYIKAWNDFPGALIKWFLKTLGNSGICELLKNENNRAVEVEACIGIYDGREFYAFSGKMEGEIARVPRGDTGFGFDAIFIPKGYDQTLAELGIEEKNKLSMRKDAFLKLKKHLDERG